MGLQNSIKYDVKALKPYTLGKAYSMALTFGTKNVELAKEKNFSFDVFRKYHSREKKFGKWKKSQKFSRPGGQSNIRPSNKLTHKNQAENRKKGLCYNFMSHDIWLRNVCDQQENVQSSLQRWQWKWNHQWCLKVKKYFVCQLQYVRSG